MAATHHPDVIVKKLEIARDIVNRYMADSVSRDSNNFKEAYKAVSEAVEENDGDDS